MPPIISDLVPEIPLWFTGATRLGLGIVKGVAGSPGCGLLVQFPSVLVCHDGFPIGQVFGVTRQLQDLLHLKWHLSGQSRTTKQDQIALTRLQSINLDSQNVVGFLEKLQERKQALSSLRQN